MGIYLNPGIDSFQKAINSEIYVDKSELISYTNKVFNTEQRYVCVSRPRRFGKSMAANMLSAYYENSVQSDYIFDHLRIAQNESYKTHLNKYNVIFLNIQEFLSESIDIKEMKLQIEHALLWDLVTAFPHVSLFNKNSLTRTLLDIYMAEQVPFVFIIDEWDCIFRERRANEQEQKLYLDFLRNLLKDRKYVGLAYMTGILPIKKYGSHSALNMFDEFSMSNPGRLAAYVGFTESEVEALCHKYKMNFEETKRWYDGYRFDNAIQVYNPRSVVSSMLSGIFDSYWNRTETFEALRDYIMMNHDGLKDTVIELLAGNNKRINTSKFTNDMDTFRSADDVLTLLIHLGYLGYDYQKQEVFIPNYEVASEFCNAIEDAGWSEVLRAIQKSEELLKLTLDKNATEVASYVEEAHFETSVLQYNDENALACVISLAYYSAKNYYTIYRELPTGKGFADLVFMPRNDCPDRPALIIELKWDESADGAIRQIKERKYMRGLKFYKGKLLLVGINYDKRSKEHQCLIEEWSM